MKIKRRKTDTEEDKEDTPEQSGKDEPDGPKEEKAIPKAKAKQKTNLLQQQKQKPNQKQS